MSLLDEILVGDATLADQEEALKNPETACWFALRISGADIEKCKEAACKNPYWAYVFAKYIPKADIKKCQKSACRDPFYAYHFARNIITANMKMSLEACRGTVYENKMNQILMERALL